MSTINSPVRVNVDEMTVHKGPGDDRIKEVQSYLEEVGVNVLRSNRATRVNLTLSTAASTQKFERRVVITEVVTEREDWLQAILDAEVPFYDLELRATGRYKIKGYIDNWYFTGIYEPLTRKGLLTEVVYDPEAEAEEDRLDGLEQELIRSQGGL